MSGVDHAQAIIKALDADPTTTDPTAVSQDIKNKLGSANVTACKSTQTGMDHFQATITSIQSDPNASNRKPEWEQKIDDDAEKQKAMASAAIDDAKSEAIKVIQAAPEAARPAAANLYMQGTAIVAGVFQSFTGAIKNVLGRVADFFIGIFSSITNAFNAVKNTVTGAISSIGSFFGSIFDISVESSGTGTAVQDPTKGAPQPLKGSATASTPVYTGLLNWPGSTRLGAAARALEYVQEVLVEKGYDISGEEMSKGDYGVESKTVFTTAKAHTGAGSASLNDLAMIWEKCVALLGQDGHFIPAKVL